MRSARALAGTRERRWSGSASTAGGDRDLPIVLGDDMTDESAFMAFDDAITICVDPRRATAAKYQLESPEEVRVFLDWVRQMCGKPTAESTDLDGSVTSWVSAVISIHDGPAETCRSASP